MKETALATVTIVNFGNDRACHTAGDFLTALKACRGRSIAMHSQTPRGLMAVRYWDVLSTGEVVESYGKQQPVDLHALVKVLGF